jgi:hypothetical protein
MLLALKHAPGPIKAWALKEVLDWYVARYEKGNVAVFRPLKLKRALEKYNEEFGCGVDLSRHMRALSQLLARRIGRTWALRRLPPRELAVVEEG